MAIRSDRCPITTSGDNFHIAESIEYRSNFRDFWWGEKVGFDYFPSFNCLFGKIDRSGDDFPIFDSF
jgi:hypothetical protein